MALCSHWLFRGGGVNGDTRTARTPHVPKREKSGGGDGEKACDAGGERQVGKESGQGREGAECGEGGARQTGAGLMPEVLEGGLTVTDSSPPGRGRSLGVAHARRASAAHSGAGSTGVGFAGRAAG